MTDTKTEPADYDEAMTLDWSKQGLTVRELALISSLKCEPLDVTDTHVLLKTLDKRYQLCEIRERRGKYLQFVANFTVEEAARRAFKALDV